MRRSFPTLSACLSTAVLLSVAALAAPSVSVVATKQGARLLVHGRLITIFKTANRGLSPADRAQKAADRLRKLVADGLTANEIEVRPRGESWGVFGGGGLLMLATPQEAEERGEEPKETATRWAQNLKAALPKDDDAPSRPGKGSPKRKPAAQPKDGDDEEEPVKAKPRPEVPLSVEDPSFVVPVGETRVQGVRGSAQGALSVKVTDGGEVAAVSVASGKPALEIRGLVPGKAVVHLERGGKELEFNVWVKRYAGRLGKAPVGGVTGTLAPASFVRRAAEERVLDAVTWEPGAIVKVTGPPEGVRALARGQETTVSVPITITGDAYLPVKTVAKVEVRNLTLPAQEAKSLLYSNDPEAVREFGTLYEGMLDPSGPVRLFYHHQNNLRRAMVFQLYLVNPGDEPADVQVIEGRAGPFIDPLQVGHRAGQQFMEASAQELGYVTRVPAHGSRAVYVATVPDRETVSGLCTFRVLEGGALVVHLSAVQEAARPAIPADLLETARNEPHIYPTPQKAETYSYAVGAHWTFMPIGRKAITGKSTNRKLFGNYGVLYNISVNLSNPTAEEKTVRVVLSPEAGWARGVFIIDGKLIEVPQIAPPAEAVLWSIKLAPQEQRRVNIQGIPVGGSFYPVSLVVRS